MATSDIVGDTSSATGRTTANTGLPAGAERSAPSPATLNIRDAQGNIQKQDLRVKIKVPPSILNTFIKKAVSGRLISQDSSQFKMKKMLEYILLQFIYLRH
jgi:hypothetical protein